MLTNSQGQRTVYRLTVVKAWNSEEIDGYVKLVDLGKPDFIEVKGVTYCGSSKASSLTMSNVPYHDEVGCLFVQRVCVCVCMCVCLCVCLCACVCVCVCACMCVCARAPLCLCFVGFLRFL